MVLRCLLWARCKSACDRKEAGSSVKSWEKVCREYTGINVQAERL